MPASAHTAVFYCLPNVIQLVIPVKFARAVLEFDRLLTLIGGMIYTVLFPHLADRESASLSWDSTQDPDCVTLVAECHAD